MSILKLIEPLSKGVLSEKGVLSKFVKVMGKQRSFVVNFW